MVETTRKSDLKGWKIGDVSFIRIREAANLRLKGVTFCRFNRPQRLVACQLSILRGRDRSAAGETIENQRAISEIHRRHHKVISRSTPNDF